MYRFLLALSMLSISSSSFADTLTLSSFQSTKDTSEIQFYINGVGVGYLYANALLQVKGKDLMFCQPAGLTLIGANYISFIESEVKRPSTGKPYQGNDQVEVILLNALRVNFPCKQ